MASSVTTAIRSRPEAVRRSPSRFFTPASPGTDVTVFDRVLGRATPAVPWERLPAWSPMMDRPVVHESARTGGSRREQDQGTARLRLACCHPPSCRTPRSPTTPTVDLPRATGSRAPPQLSWLGAWDFSVLLGVVESLAAGEVHVPGGWPLSGAAAVAGAAVLVGTVGLALAAGIDRLLKHRSAWKVAAAYAFAGLLAGAAVGIVLAGIRGAPVIFPVAGALAGVTGGLVSHRGVGGTRVVAFILAGLLLALALPVAVRLAAPLHVTLAVIAVVGAILATTRR